jgi:hypothetical protein
MGKDFRKILGYFVYLGVYYSGIDGFLPLWCVLFLWSGVRCFAYILSYMYILTETHCIITWIEDLAILVLNFKKCRRYSTSIYKKLYSYLQKVFNWITFLESGTRPSSHKPLYCIWFEWWECLWGLETNINVSTSGSRIVRVVGVSYLFLGRSAVETFMNQNHP